MKLVWNGFPIILTDAKKINKAETPECGTADGPISIIGTGISALPRCSCSENKKSQKSHLKAGV